MKKALLLFAVFTALTLQVNATKHTINISGSSYTPALTSALLGDTVTINASTFHPLVQVSKSTWTSNGNNALSGGFGTKTSSYSFVLGTVDTVYFVCSAHVQFGMKGRIAVAQSSGINDFNKNPLTLSLYPNPVAAQGTIKITVPGNQPLSVQVFSITGQLEKDLSSGLTYFDGSYYGEFDSSALPGGNHFVLVNDGHQKVVSRFEVIR
ncbi:MAG: T9SS type A sorting domain-containing protein [Bacteroidales bacterium]|jgi:plastocyanin